MESTNSAELVTGDQRPWTIRSNRSTWSLPLYHLSNLSQRFFLCIFSHSLMHILDQAVELLDGHPYLGWTCPKLVVYPPNLTRWGHGIFGGKDGKGSWLGRSCNSKRWAKHFDIHVAWFMAWVYLLHHLSLAASLILQTLTSLGLRLHHQSANSVMPFYCNCPLIQVACIKYLCDSSIKSGFNSSGRKQSDICLAKSANRQSLGVSRVQHFSTSQNSKQKGTSEFPEFESIS